MSKEYRNFAEKLNKNGYRVVRTNGDHVIWSNGNNSLSINIKPNKMVMRRLIKENNLQ